MPETPPDLPVIPDGPPLLVVLSAPSAAGKDTIRDLLIGWELPAHFAVTATDRPQRPGEVEGRDYRFLTEQQFLDLLAADGFIEHAIVYGQHKGVPKDEILAPLAAGRDVIARVDVQGAATLKQLWPDALLIFIAPPSLEEMQRRLEGRDTDPEHERRLRIETAPAEMEAARVFDHVVVNETGRAEAAARRIVELIAEAKQKLASRDLRSS